MGVLIRAYGELWSPDLVDWGKRGAGNRGSLPGEFGPRASPVTVDVWDQQGIYVLSHDWRVIYVGKADKVALGARVRQHLSDELAGRWDRFSWFGIRGVNKSGVLGAEVKNKNTDSSSLVATFEALLIAVTEPPRNKRSEEIPGARRVLQAGAERPRPIASYMNELSGGVRDLAERLDRLERRVEPN